MEKTSIRYGLFGVLMVFQAGCATLFGWDVHAPGILSQEFLDTIKPIPQRVALYVPPESLGYQSKDRGSRFADPQTYHVGEAFGAMLVEAFQNGFEEFVFIEVEPNAAILRQYGISYLAVVVIRDFGNRVTLKGQALSLVTETVVYDSDLHPLARFESRGLSDAQKVFAKKGGPEVNLNASIERNALAIVQHLQDSMTTGSWPLEVSS